MTAVVGQTSAQGVAAVLARLAAAVDEAVGVVADGLADDPALVEQLRTVSRAASRLDAASAVLVSRVETSGRWRDGEAGSVARFVTLTLGLMPSSARRLLRLGRALTRQLPEFEAPALAGQISPEQVLVTAKTALASQARIEALGQHVEIETPLTSDWEEFHGTDPHRVDPDPHGLGDGPEATNKG